jgi:hypothetical protein
MIAGRKPGSTRSPPVCCGLRSVAAEVVVFFLIGPALLRRLGPARAAALAAAAAALLGRHGDDSGGRLGASLSRCMACRSRCCI